MIRKFLAYYSIILLFVTCVVSAQPQILKIWPKGVPGVIENPNYKEEIITIESGKKRITKVTEPTISVFLPQKEKATGTAIVVCPGGGYARLAMENEGSPVATWLNDAGIACILLKYRLPSDEIMKNKSIGPLQDVQEAIRIVRRNAREWDLAPDKIGVMGFSAGGHLAACASTMFDEKHYDCDTTSARPNFSILVYPVISMQKEVHSGSQKRLLGENPDKNLIDHFSTEMQVKQNTPNAFIVHAADDKSVSFQNSLMYFQALKEKNISAEMHVFEIGGHGFSLAKSRASTESQWTNLCVSWLKMHGLLQEK
jgi:acetyl esterase/lipase